ncbi:hypothetical protein, partial [Kitasatospora aureofaciens]|uniref:hypothetical protein n=1 Tax=Kitasatospora aureofaciens TaxID=1894 RepID=UPI0005273325
YEQLQAQAAGADYSPLSAHLDNQVRAALALPPVPAPLDIDQELAARIRQFFLKHPEQVAQLPDAARDLLAL